MIIDLTGFIECAAAGIRPEAGKINGFAEACYHDNSVSELVAALKSRSADKIDCKNWNLTPSRWRAEIKSALEYAMFQYVSDNDL